MASEEFDEVVRRAIKAEHRFIRLVAKPVLRQIRTPPRGFPIADLEELLAKEFNKTSDAASRFQAFDDLMAVARYLLTLAPLSLEDLERQFPKHPEDDGDPLCWERTWFEYMSVTLAEVCIARHAVICLAVDGTHHSPADPEWFSGQTEGSFSARAVVDEAWTAEEAAAFFLEKSGTDRLTYILYENVEGIVQSILEKRISNIQSPSVPDAKGARTEKRRRGFEELDRPFVDQAIRLLNDGRVASDHEAARVIAEDLWENRESHVGAFPGVSADAVKARIYKRLRDRLRS